MKQSKYNIIIILGIISLVVIIIAVIVSFVQFSKREINLYNDAKVSIPSIVKDYVTNTLIEINNGEITKLWDKMDKGFLHTNNISTKDELYNFFKENKLDLLPTIIIDEYGYKEYEGDKIYFVKLKNMYDEILKPMVIKESSPRVYTIAFDNFVTADINKKVITLKNTELTIKSIDIYFSKIEMDVEIKNITNKDISVKFDYDNGNIKLNYGDKNFVYEQYNTFMGDETVIRPTQVIQNKLLFILPMDKYKEIKSITLKNVLVDGILNEEVYNIK